MDANRLEPRSGATCVGPDLGFSLFPSLFNEYINTDTFKHILFPKLYTWKWGQATSSKNIRYGLSPINTDIPVSRIKWLKAITSLVLKIFQQLMLGGGRLFYVTLVKNLFTKLFC